MKYLTLALCLVLLALGVTFYAAQRRYHNDPARLRPYRLVCGSLIVLIGLTLAYVNIFGWPF